MTGPQTSPTWNHDIPTYHQDLEEFEEHDQTWVSCKTCGASWSVHESNLGPVYEQVDDGDDYCLENQGE